ncbi:MAG: hypothetical protein WCJ50_08090 [Actinomycetes bacterium]
MRKAMLIVGAACICAMIPASAALATPSTYQHFKAKVIGKAGTDKKPASVGSFLEPYHDVGDSGGPANTGNKNTGALLEPVFETVEAHVYLPKQMTLATKGFPTCPDAVILAAPDTCPKGSDIGKGVAHGYARNGNAAPGTYLLAPELEVRVFILSPTRIGLRVISAVTAASIITGDIEKAKGAAAKKYGIDIHFIIPKGLTEPLPGIASQLSQFNATIAAVKNSKGVPLQSLKACPKNKKLDFGYNGIYNIGLDKTKSPKTATGYSISSVGPIVAVTVPCK